MSWMRQGNATVCGGLGDVKIRGVDLPVQSCLKIIISKCIVICSDFQVIYCIIFV